MPKKDKKPDRKKIIYIVAAIAVIFVIYVGDQIMKANQDVSTRKAAMAAGEKVENYIYKTKTVPDSIAVVGYKLPSTVRYEKINNTTFQFCEYFNRNNDPSVSAPKQFINLLFDRSTNLMKENSSSDDGWFGALSVDDLHYAGLHCQNVIFYTFDKK